MTINPAVVEKQLVDISLVNGLNERDRPETMDWTKWLSRVENIVYDDTGALIRRPGLTEVADLSNSSYYDSTAFSNYQLGLVKIRGGIGVDSVSNTTRKFLFLDESEPRLRDAGTVPNMTVQTRKTVSSSAYESGGAGKGRKTIQASCSSSDYDILIHQSPYISGGVVTYTIVLTDRQTGALVRRWILKNSSESICAAVYESGATKQLMIAVDTVVATYQAGFAIINIAPSALGSFPSTDITSLVTFTTLTTPGVSPGSNIRPIGITAIGNEYQLVTGVVGTTYITRISTASAILAATTIANWTCTGVSSDSAATTRTLLAGRNTATGFIELKAITPGTLATYATVASAIAMGASDVVRIAGGPESGGTGAAGLCLYTRAATSGGTIYFPTVRFLSLSYSAGAGAFDANTGPLKGWLEVTQPFYISETGQFAVTVAKSLIACSGTSVSRDTVAGTVAVMTMNGSSIGIPIVECIVDQYTASTEANEQDYGYLVTVGTTASTNVFSIAPYVTNVSGRYVVAYMKKSTSWSYGYEQVVITPWKSAPQTNGEGIIPTGILSYFDNMRVWEYGILDTPCVIPRNSGGGTGVTAGVHSWVAVLEARDSYGNVAYSRTSRVSTLTLASAVDVVIDYTEISGSLRAQLNGSALQGSTVSIKFYRTLAGGTVYYFVTSFPVQADSQSTTISSFTDNYSDATISLNHQLFKNPGTAGTPLDRYAPLYSKHAVAHKDRIFYCNGTNVYFSSFFVDGETPWFNPTFFIPIPGGTGDITGLASMDGVLVVFKVDGIWLVDGDGPPENGGTGAEFSPPRRINTELGCIDPRTIVPMPDGIGYRSTRGLEKLTRSFQVQNPPFGDPVKETLESYTYNGQAFFDVKNGRAIWLVGSGTYTHTSGSVSMPTDTITSGRAVVYDTSASAWSIWVSGNSGFVAGISAQMTAYETIMIDRFLSGGTYYGSLCKQSNTTKNDRNTGFVPMTIESGWVKMGVMQERLQVTDLLYLAKKTAGMSSGDNHNTVISVAYDYSPTYSYSKTFGPELRLDDVISQFCLNVPRQNVQSVRFKIEIQAPPANYTIGNSLGPEILGLTVRLGKRGGEAKLAPDNNG